MAPPTGFRKISLAGVDRRRGEQMVLPKVTDPLLVDKALARQVEQYRERKRKAEAEAKRMRKAESEKRAHRRPA